MILQHDALPRAVGWVRTAAAGGNTVHGSGFLVAPTRAITCAHCLCAEPGGPMAQEGTISFSQVRDSGEIPFKVLFQRLQPEAGIDVAVLELERAVDGTACLSLSGAEPQDKAWRSFGHPRAIDGHPLWLSGRVEGPVAKRTETTDGWLLSLLVEGESAPIAGMSGAPLLTGDGVVGVLSYQLYRQQSAAGAVTATPAFSKAFGVPARLLLQLPELMQSLRRSARVFIAYRRGGAETELMQALHTGLKAQGHEPFADLDMLVGQDWARELQRRLDEADFCVPLLTERAIESPMMLQELRLAYRRWRQTGRPIMLPVRDPARATLPYEIDLYLGELQYAPWSGPGDTPAVVDAINIAMDHQPLSRRLGPGSAAEPAPARAEPFVRLRSSATALPLNDPFYVERPSHQDALDRIEAGHFIWTIRAPSGFGKTSLVIRLRDQCKRQGRKVVLIDFQTFGRLPSDSLPSGDRKEITGYVTFLNDFAQVLCHGLGIAPPTQPLDRPAMLKTLLMDMVDEPSDSAAPTRNAVLILDGMDRLMMRNYGVEFFSLCRAICDDPDINFSFIFCITVNPDVLIRDVHRSPFNIGSEPMVLEPFDEAVLAQLAARAGLTLKSDEVTLLHQVTGGHPALTRQALAYVLAPGEAGGRSAPSRSEIAERIEQIYNHCGLPEGGPFSAHLKSLLSRLQAASTAAPHERERPDLVRLMCRIAKDRKMAPEEQQAGQKLQALGLVKPRTKRALFFFGPRREQLVPASLAYAMFFRDHIAGDAS